MSQPTESCSASTIQVFRGMRNGIYLTELELERVSSKGIAAIDNDIIRGFDDRYFYFVGRLVRVEYPRPKRRGIVASCGESSQGQSNSRFQAIIYGEEAFSLRGEVDGDSSIKIALRGTLQCELPWS